ncbi:MAG: hypothetical protein LJF06_07880 [Gemmatimonadetes bacterium]|nr:hypothetical protein [Gemmatimonadota bacterium]
MLSHTNRRRGRRMVATTLLALVAQALLVMASPLADVHYHQSGPLEIASAGSHHLTQHPGPCPECMAMQTLAVPGTPAYSLRWDWSRENAPAPTPVLSRAAVRSSSKFARGPPAPRSATLQTL